MSRRGPIATGLFLVAATAILSACTAHHSGHGTVYRPHDGAVRTGPVRTRTTVTAPHRGRYRDYRYRRDRHGRYHRDRDGRYYRDRDGRYYRDRNRRDRYGNDRDRRDKGYPGYRQPSAPATAKRPDAPAHGVYGAPPAHGLYGTQPGHLKRQAGPKKPAMSATRASKGQTRKSPPHGGKNQQTTKQSSPILEQQAAPPKASFLTGNPRAKGGFLQGKQPNAESHKDELSGS